MEEKQVFRNSFYYMIASFAPVAVNLVVLPVFTRYLSPQDYGILALTQVCAVFLPLLLSLQIHSSLGRFYFDYEGRERKILISTIGLSLLLFSVFSLIILLVFSHQILSLIFPKIPVKMYVLFKLTLAIAFFNTLTEMCKMLLMVREEARLFMRASIFLFLIGLVFNIIEVVVLKKGAYGVVEATLLLSVLSLIVYIFLNRRLFILSFRAKMLRDPIKYSLPIIPHALAGIIFMYSDRIIMEKYVLLSAIGLYSIADKVAMIFKTIVNQLHFAFLPHFNKTAVSDKRRALEDADNIAKVTIFVVSFLISIFALFSVEIVYYLLDNRYFNSWIIIPILASSYIFRSLYCFSSTGLFFVKKTGRIALITITAAALNIFINLEFMPKYGMIVAVFSTLASFIVTYLMAVVMSIRTFYIRLDNKVNLVSIGYMYLAIVFAFYVNSKFTLEQPSLPRNIYILKVLVILGGLFLGWAMKVFRFDSVLSLGKTTSVNPDGRL